LQLAKDTQDALLPAVLPTVGHLICESFSRPARHVCGDFYDLVVIADQTATAVVADVSGKGVAAALLGATLLGSLQILLRSGENLDAVTARLNTLMCDRSGESQYATMFLITLMPDGKGSYVNAGHNPAYLFRASGQQIEELPSTSSVVGMIRDAPFVVASIELNKGDLLVIYSDGFTEAESPDGILFGPARMRDVIKRAMCEPTIAQLNMFSPEPMQDAAEGQAIAGATRVRTAVLEEIEDFTKGQSLSDDMTLFVIEKT
jgi:sigma-B regulation protein RsbU (phosphoserine phosphatase)